MSGIYGVYRYDGAPVDQQWLDRMKMAMSYYGPHGSGCKIDGSVGMGHLLLEVNPEDSFEEQPLRGARGLVACAARLDNRDALLETLDVSASEPSQLSDGHLVSLAFDRWGERLSTHLQGDWALAAWDRRERKLLLTKDAFGNSTLYYYEGKGFIAFASSLKALLALPGTVKEPDRLRLAQVLVAWQNDAELTAYKGFRRMLWAQAKSFAHDGQARTWSHWSMDAREPLKYRRDTDYEEDFLEHYTRAVRSCLRTRKPLAAQLSGGRDSGSMVSLAAPILASQGRSLTAYTSVPWLPPDGAGNERMGNEWGMAHATAAMSGPNVQHRSVDAANYRVLEGIERLIDIHEGPGHSSNNHFWMQALYEAVLRDGHAGVLTGQMGNATVSWGGSGSVLFALVHGHRATALRLFLHAEPNPWLFLKRQVLKPICMPGLRVFRRLRAPSNSPWRAYSALNTHMASELNLDRRMRAAGFDATYTHSPLQDTHRFYFEPEFGIGAGLMGEIAARHSLSNLDPTSNQSLLEFILRVPDDQFRHAGRSSWLLRRAFRNRLPVPVLNMEKKGLQAADVGHRILRELPAFRECLNLLDSLPEARDILDMPMLHRCLGDLVERVDPGTTARASMILLRGLGVGLFLRRVADSHF